MGQIKRINWESRRNYGSPKITKQLNAEGIPVSKKNSGKNYARRMHSLKNSQKYKATTNSKHNLPIYLNLLGQQFKVKLMDSGYYVYKDEWMLDLLGKKTIALLSR